MIDLLGYNIEDVEKTMRGHLPQGAITIICELLEQQRMLQRAMNDQQILIRKVMKSVVLLHQLHGQVTTGSVEQDLNKFDKKYEDKNLEMIKHQNMSEDK